MFYQDERDYWLSRVLPITVEQAQHFYHHLDFFEVPFKVAFPPEDP